MTNYECLEDRVLVLPIKEDQEHKTSGGIVAPLTIHKTTRKGVVVNVGSGYTARDTGLFIPTVLHKGDTVLIGAEAGLEIDIPNESGDLITHLLMREGDVLCLLSKKSEE